MACFSRGMACRHQYCGRSVIHASLRQPQGMRCGECVKNMQVIQLGLYRKEQYSCS
jgi:hypothetical protein